MSEPTPKLKIGFVIDDSLDKPDGVQQYVLAVGEWLRTQGHDVHYLTSTTERRDLANVHVLGKNKKVRYNGNRLSIPLPASRAAIKQLLEQEKFDVLHVQTPYSPQLGQRIIMAADPQTAVVGTFHIVPYSRLIALTNYLLARWNGRSLQRFDQIFSVSSAAQAFAKRAYGVESTVLPNVVDYQRFATAKPMERRSNRLRIVFLGRLVPRKGCLTLLKAIWHLSRRMQGVPAFEVIICGRGPLEAKLKKFVHDHQLESAVRFVGFVDEADKPRYLRSADIAVFPSSGGESFGIVLLEAMAAGAAVLAGDNVGYRSVMKDRPELLFAPRDAQQLADKLSWLLRDERARQKAQDWGSTYAQTFDTTVVGRKLEQSYAQILEKRAGRAIIKP